MNNRDNKLPYNSGAVNRLFGLFWSSQKLFNNNFTITRSDVRDTLHSSVQNFRLHDSPTVFQLALLEKIFFLANKIIFNQKSTEEKE